MDGFSRSTRGATVGNPLTGHAHCVSPVDQLNRAGIDIVDSTPELRRPGRVHPDRLIAGLVIGADKHLMGKFKAVFDREGAPSLDQCQQFRCHTSKCSRRRNHLTEPSHYATTPSRNANLPIDQILRLSRRMTGWGRKATGLFDVLV